MSNFWKFIVGVVLFLAAMILLTYFVPGIKQYAASLAKQKDLPLWLIGLVAPILFMLKKFKNFALHLVGESKTEQEIREQNEQIKAQMQQLRQDVTTMDQWMRQNVSQELAQVQALNQRISTLQGKQTQVQNTITQVENTAPQQFVQGKTAAETAQILNSQLAAHGMQAGKPAELVD